MGFKKINIIIIFSLFLWVLFVSFVPTLSVFADDEQKFKEKILITVNKTNFVKKKHIFLKDIADVQANAFFKEALDKLDLGRSPNPGQVKLFDKNKILSIIAHQRYLPANIDFISPQKIYVKRYGQTISKHAIRQFIDKKLLEIFNDKEYMLKTLNIRGLEQYPEGEVKLQFDSNEIINHGKLSCYINVIIDEDRVDRVNISGRVAIYENILFAKKSLKKGDIITRDSVYQAKKNIYNLREGFIKTIDELDGKMLKSSVRKGDYLKQSNLEKPPLVKKGDIITLVVKNSTLSIFTPGISLENGCENDLIKVENLGSGKLVRGIVKTKSKVEVIF